MPLRDQIITGLRASSVVSRRAATRRHEIGEFVVIKWLERVEWDGSLRGARRMRPETASGRVGKPRLARPLPPGLPPRVFRRDLALDNIRRSRTLTHVGGVAEDRNLLRRLSPIESDGA
jgi:hypothetical protein